MRVSGTRERPIITKANAGVGLSNRPFVLAQSSLTKLVYTVDIVQMRALMAM